MIEGIVKTIFALTIRPFGAGYSPAALSELRLRYLWGNLSTVAEWMLGFLLGILLVVEGTALSSLAWRVRREI